MTARDRLRAWREAGGLTREQAAKLIDCTPGMVAHIESGRRLPGRRLSNAIEAATRGWSDGPIASVEWDELESALPPTGTEGE